jgi:hypothetical protein
MRALSLEGKRFESLFVVTRLASNKRGKSLWLCRCDCGQEAVVCGTNLQKGHTRSCGCLRMKSPQHQRGPANPSFRHGCSSGCRANASVATPEYKAYGNAKDRCQNPDNHAYSDYGGRGIEFRFASFNEFMDEMGPKPESKQLYSLDRWPNNDGHYEFGNVRWATRTQQQRNRRPIPVGRPEIKTETLVQLYSQGLGSSAIAKRLDMDASAILRRLHRAGIHPHKRQAQREANRTRTDRQADLTLDSI